MPAKRHKDQHPYMLMPLHADKAALQAAESGNQSAEAWQGSMRYWCYLC